MAETAEQRRQRLVIEAKGKAAMDKLEQSAATASADDRAAAYGAVGKPKPAPVSPPEEVSADAGAVSTGAAGGNVSDRIRQRGTESARAGLSLLSEADRKVRYKVANKDYRSVKGYTDAMQGQAPVRREGRFQAARAGLATLRPPEAAPAPEAAPQPAQGAPVQVTIQTAPSAAQPAAPAPRSSGRAVPAGAAPKAAPGQLPTASVPAEAIPLEGDAPADETPEQQLARLEAEALAQTPEQLEAQASADYAGEPAPEPSAEDLAAEADARKGIMQRQLNAEEDLATARVGVAEAEAEAMAEASTKYQDALSQAEAAKAEQDALVAERLAASEEATRLVDRTSKEAIDAAAVDPKRAWSNMGLGRKAAFVLSSISLGVAGNEDPAQYMRRYIDQDIEQQVQDHAKLQANVGTAREAAAEQGNLYSRTLAAVGDQRVAADVVRVARIDQITADLKARLSAAGVQQVSAEQEAFLTKLEEDKAAAQMRIQQAADHNPKTFTKTAYVYGKGAREGMRLLGKEQIKAGVDAGTRADTQEADLEKIDYKGRADALAEQAKAAAKKGEKVAERAYKFGTDTATAQVVIDQIDQILALDDIPGYAYTEGVATPGKMDTDAQIKTTLESLGRLQSQGAITNDELANFSSMVMEGVTAGDGSIFETSEARLRKNLANVKNMVNLKVKAIERGLDPEARDFYNRNVASADFEARWTGGGDESVVEED